MHCPFRVISFRFATLELISTAGKRILYLSDKRPLTMRLWVSRRLNVDNVMGKYNFFLGIKDVSLQILEMKPIEKKQGFTPEFTPSDVYANSVEYRLSTDFAEGMFASCKDVTFGGQPALRVMCTSTPCTLHNWLNFIGTQNLDLNIPISTKFMLYDPSKVCTHFQVHDKCFPF